MVFFSFSRDKFFFYLFPSPFHFQALGDGLDDRDGLVLGGGEGEAVSDTEGVPDDVSDTEGVPDGV